jgi:prepilin-type processing-associated H-X9-DG protein
MRHHGFTLLQAIVVFIFVMVLVAFLWPTGHGEGHESYRRAACAMNLKQIALALKQYSADNNDQFPAVGINTTRTSRARPFGWADAIYPYTKSVNLLQCRAEPTEANPDPTQSGYTDYWYNANCARQEEKNFTYVSQTVLLGDGAIGGGNARYSVTSEVNTTEETSRHLGGNNFAFADGHVKWFKPGKVTTTPSDGTGATFAIK